MTTVFMLFLVGFNARVAYLCFNIPTFTGQLFGWTNLVMSAMNAAWLAVLAFG